MLLTDIMVSMLKVVVPLIVVLLLNKPLTSNGFVMLRFLLSSSQLITSVSKLAISMFPFIVP